jgi:L-threonylcarbamoyladenylate synthase
VERYTCRMILPVSSASIDYVASLLRDGAVVAIPTETVYGLACSIDHPEAIRRVFELKGRPSDNPLIVHVHSIEQAYELVRESDHDVLCQIGSCFWPGPLTIVLQRSARVSDYVTAGLETVAIRMPDHPVALDILRHTGCPLAAPSANISGRPSPTRASHVEQDFGDRVPVIDAGPCTHGLESTVVRIVDGQCVILRLGAIDRETLQRSLPGYVVRVAGQDDERYRSPGTRYRHYAPSATLILCDSIDHLRAELSVVSPSEAVVLMTQRSASEYPDVVSRPLLAATLFDEFRRADALLVSTIIVLCDDETRSNEALLHRLMKAAATDH